MQYIGVIDCNNFFVSCERLFRPDLLGKPVVVLSSNDGCVVARSQEIKDMGIPMGVPYFKVKDIFKKERVTTFSSHFALYRDISRRVFAEVRKQFPDMEQYSIDEAFFCFSVSAPEDAQRELSLVKRTLEQRVGIPVSIGLGLTKTQAKYANRLAKKQGGVIVLTPEMWALHTPSLPLADLWGVGRQLVRRYADAGLKTVADILLCPRPRLDSLFGIGGLRLQAELAGTVMYPVAKRTEAQKSIMSSRSFKQTTTELSVVKDAVAYHVRHAAAELRRFGLLASTITVSILPSRHGDYVLRGGSRLLQLPAPTCDTTELLRVVSTAVDQLYEPGVPYKKAGVVLGQFVPVDFVQTSLFATDSSAQKENVLMDTIDALNARFGREMLQIGKQTADANWSAKCADISPAYTTDWLSLPVVTAKK